MTLMMIIIIVIVHYLQMGDGSGLYVLKDFISSIRYYNIT